MPHVLEWSGLTFVATLALAVCVKAYGVSDLQPIATIALRSAEWRCTAQRTLKASPHAQAVAARNDPVCDQWTRAADRADLLPISR